MHPYPCLRNRSARCPQGTNSDDMDRLLADKGLLTRLEDVSHKVADKAQTVAGRAGDLVVNAMGFWACPTSAVAIAQKPVLIAAALSGRSISKPWVWSCPAVQTSKRLPPR